MAEEVTNNLAPVLSSGKLTQGAKVEEYEQTLIDWFKYPYIASVNSGTSGLILALRLLNLKAGDEVLCTPLTCLASNFPVLTNNLRIKWVDVDPYTCNMDLDDLERKITQTTKAILVVHWGGNPIDLTRLNTIRDTYGIPVIEDCAHAFGAVYENKYIGKHGNIAVFSTQAIKHLTTGDGGLIFLPTSELYNRAKLLRWYGIDRDAKTKGGDFRIETNVAEWGYKFHMNDINATIGLTNLPYIRRNIEYARKCVRTYYDNVIDNLEHIYRIQESPNSESAFWLYTIRVSRKTEFIEYMKQNDITVSQVHNRNDGHSCLSDFKTDLPQLDKLETEIVCIPCGWWVSEKEYKCISKKLQQWDFRLSLEIRELKNTDFSYLSLLEQLTGYTYDASVFKLNLEKIACQGATIYVLTYREEIIATAKLFIEYKFGGNIAHIEDVVVDARFRGKNVGTLLLNYLILLAEESNVYKIVLNAKDSLADFYGKSGFIHESGLYTLRL